MAKTVSAAHARANLPQLLKDVEKGKSIVIRRYNRPIAIISPIPGEQAEKPLRRFGSGKGRLQIVDPHWADPMTDQEVEAMLEGRY
jgi:antitoxin (DNA-binding transcriptional repressor) of toxin-antitoxin stability system